MIVNRNENQIRAVHNFINTFNETVNDRTALNDIYNKSYAQLYQDMFVLWYNNFKRNGYFVEFGSTDGKTISNTYLLEKEFGWNGIVAEPAKVWHDDLFKNRTCHIDTNCVWHTSNLTVEFDEGSYPEWSTTTDHITDVSRIHRGHSNVYEVNTIDLNDLLSKYDAPYEIDYISLDTEGSELEILKAFDFSKYKVNFISCEHNDHHESNQWNRKKIYEFLTGKGYERVWAHLSAQDDWYVLPELNTKSIKHG